MTRVREAGARDRDAVVRMRTALWPDSEPAEVDALLAAPEPDVVVLIAESDDGAPCGFAEVGERKFADGCVTSPVGYLEGLWVDAAVRRAGVGSSLVRAAMEWARERGLREFASDVEASNEASLRFHDAVGFEEVQRSVCFRAEL